MFHLAAAVGVKLIVEQPVHTIETNVHGTEVVLKHANKKKKLVVIASTSEVYGKSDDVPFREDSDLVLGPTPKHRWAYACSKAIDEFLALAYWKERKLPVIIVRFFNTVGPRQTGQYGMVIPNFVRQALAGEPITVFGDGTQSRSFTHVADVVDALLKLVAEPAAIGQVINLGNTEEVTIRALAERVRTLAGSSSPIKNVPYDEAYESGFEDMPRRVPDLTKARNMIGYEPKLGLDDILVRDHRALPTQVRPRLEALSAAARILGECEFQVHFSLAAAVLSWAAPARAEVQLRIENGLVSLKATNATVREILAEWARVGQTRIVNGERMPGGPITHRADRRQRGTSARNHPALRRRVRDGAARHPQSSTRRATIASSSCRRARRRGRGRRRRNRRISAGGAAAVSGAVPGAVSAAIPAAGSAAVSGRAGSAAVPAAVSAAAAGERRRADVQDDPAPNVVLPNGSPVFNVTPRPPQQPPGGAVRHAPAGWPAARGRLDAGHGRSGAAASSRFRPERSRERRRNNSSGAHRRGERGDRRRDAAAGRAATQRACGC